MKKNLSKLALLFLVLFVVAGFMSCDLNKDEVSLAVIGEWNAGFGSSAVITASQYEVYYNDVLSYSGKIVSFNNSSWNAGETGEGSYGYFVVQFDNPSAYTPESKDKYMVVRWQNFLDVEAAAAMSYSEGSDYPTNTYFDSIDDALEGATGAAGFFGYFTTATQL